MFNEVLGFNIQKEKYNNDKMKKKSFLSYRSAGIVGTETIGAAERFSAKILRAFFIFCRDAAFAAAFLAESIISSS